MRVPRREKGAEEPHETQETQAYNPMMTACASNWVMRW